MEQVYGHKDKGKTNTNEQKREMSVPHEISRFCSFVVVCVCGDGGFAVAVT